MKKKLVVIVMLITAALSANACSFGGQNAQKSSSGKDTGQDSSVNQDSSSTDNGTGSGNNSSGTGSTSSIESVNAEIAAYFPYQKNTWMIYTGNGNEYASYRTYTDYISGNRAQTRTDNGGTETATVYEIKNGKLKQLVARAECYYRENFTTASYSKGDVLIEAPLKKGTSWKLSDGSVRSISGVGISVKIYSGTYKTLRVTTSSSDGKTVDYYAKGIGLIKSVYTAKIDPANKISSTLTSVKKNAAMTQTIRFYYPNSDLTGMYYQDKKIAFHTNDITRLILTKKYKVLPSSKTATVLTAHATMNSLYLNRVAGQPYVDMSSEFRSEMNAGSGYESLILQSLVNTIGVYYDHKKVYLTVSNQPYSSGHIQMNKGEYFTVNTKSAKPLP